MLHKCTSYHVAISTPSGNGKSFHINRLVKSYLATGSKIRVIKPNQQLKQCIEWSK